MEHRRAGPSLLLQPKTKRNVEEITVETSSTTAREQSREQREKITRYFKAARELYLTERHENEWKALENPFGFAPSNTSETLRQLLSPLRPIHELDRWTPYEIYVFELGLQHFGKQFHSIQQLISTKSTREVIAFYYIWKKFGLAKEDWTKAVPAKDPFGMKQMKLEREKHGILPTAFDLLSDDDDDTVLAVKQQSLQAAKKRRMEHEENTSQCTSPLSQKNCERMQNVHSIIKEYLSATRSLFAVSTDTKANALQSYIKELGLDGTAQLKPVFSILSGLREKHILDSWTPFELCIFELGLELYGKHFHYISKLLPKKSTRDTIALYYIWKVNNPIHDHLKHKWSQA